VTKIIQLDDNLILRAATFEDADKVVELNRLVHGDPKPGEPDVAVGHWTRDLFNGVNPAIGPSDFTVVEDTSNGEIVSTICLMEQVWNIGGIDTLMGMPEIVGTHPNYRNRGLVRKQFDLMHKWSVARGHLFNTIMGIPEYYKLFGYEYALDAWGGSATTPALLDSVCSGKDEKPPFTARDAEEADIQFIADTYQTVRDRAFVTVNRDVAAIERELFSVHEKNPMHWKCRILLRDDTPVGFYMFGSENMYKTIRVDMLEIAASANWLDATTSMLVDVRGMTERFHPEGKERCEKIEFEFGPNHPAFKMFDMPFGAPKRKYQWYVRVEDVAKLISHLKPLFEQRLADSEFRGWSGDLKISFYKNAIEMKFDQGKLVSAENIGFIERSEASAHYPGLTFLKALFGQHSFSYLKDHHGGASSKDFYGTALQDTLFGGPLISFINQVS